MEIEKTLKDLREKTGITQEQVAEAILVSRQTISKWETGKSLPDIISIIKLSDIYKISVDELLKGDPKMQLKIEEDLTVAKNNKRVMFITAIIMSSSLFIYFISIFIGGEFKYFCENAIRWVLSCIGLVFVGTVFLNMKKNNRLKFHIGGLTMQKLQITSIVLLIFGIWLAIFSLTLDSDLPEVVSIVSTGSGLICAVISLFGKKK